MSWNPLSALMAKIYAVIAITALLALAWQTVRIDGLGPIDGLKDVVAELTEDLKTVTGQRDAEIRAHETTKTNYRTAQREAAALERERLAAVRAQQKEVSDAIAQDYQRRLAAVRARADELRRQAATGAGAAGAGGAGAVPGVSAAGGRAAQAPGDPRLPLATLDQLERDLVASEQAEQLDALIDFAIAQAAIDPNPPLPDQEN